MTTGINSVVSLHLFLYISVNCIHCYLSISKIILLYLFDNEVGLIFSNKKTQHFSWSVASSSSSLFYISLKVWQSIVYNKLFLDCSLIRSLKTKFTFMSVWNRFAIFLELLYIHSNLPLKMKSMKCYYYDSNRKENILEYNESMSISILFAKLILSLIRWVRWTKYISHEHLLYHEYNIVCLFSGYNLINKRKHI